jgi:flagellar protein FlbD
VHSPTANASLRLKKWGKTVIEVTKLDGTKTLINQELIETVESTPDTVVTLTTGRKIITKESRQEIDNLVKSYRKELYANLPIFDRM